MHALLRARMPHPLQSLQAQRTNDYPSPKIHEFVKLTEELIHELRRRCDAPGIEEELAKGELW